MLIIGSRNSNHFVYGECTFEKVVNNPAIIIEVAARKNAWGLSYHHPTINSHDVVINMYSSGISAFTLHIPQDVSIAKRMAFEFNPSLGVMAKNS